jgi:hypothetical protein
MPALTRRRDSNAPQETWRVYYGDVIVGTIGIRSGVPAHVDQWRWSCGSGFPSRRARAGYRAGLLQGARRIRVRLAPAGAESDRGHEISSRRYAVNCAYCPPHATVENPHVAFE